MRHKATELQPAPRMVKPAFILKRTHNALLDMLAGWDTVRALPSENELARRFDVSRTTVGSALRGLEAAGLLARRTEGLFAGRHPAAGDYFTDGQTVGPREIVERTFMQQILQGRWQPGEELSESDLARASGCSIASVREFLIGFQHFHLVEKRARGGWRMLGFHAGFAEEVADMRWLIETAAMQRLTAQPDPAWRDKACDLLERHRLLQADMQRRHREFPMLDREFHLWIAGHLRNRFAEDFFDVVSLVFHYHYQWNRIDERERNHVAVDEHIGVLSALVAGERALARQRLCDHLTTSRESLIRSLQPG
jgi:DNA-binding GntR family transcriptional regulator